MIGIASFLPTTAENSCTGSRNTGFPGGERYESVTDRAALLTVLKKG